jgi:hypothetical protein
MLRFRPGGITNEEFKRNSRQNARVCASIGKETLDWFLAHGGWTFQLKLMLGTDYKIYATLDDFNHIVITHGAALRKIGYECVYDAHKKKFGVQPCK